ncbi:MAG: hypothetical protein H7245_02200 [Candidatus Saccharibacteria bacterium]|nr:hypothetical protein [Pseudorhodobacter sp.]
MSETMSSVEIEDVLSSIRRLVSEDLRPGPRSTPVPPVDRPRADDKLILTPAFRVVSDPAPAPLPRLHLGVAPVTRIISTLERSLEAHSTEWESEVGDPPLLINDMEWSEDGWVAPSAVAPPAAAPSAQVVSFATPSPDAPSPDALEPDTVEPDTFDVAPQDPTPSWAQVDPEMAEVDAISPPPITEPDRQWADRAEAEAVAELQAETPPKPETAELPLDEQVLRELVRELIVAELQGTLGERITRNVRKLVRAEIARAISLNGVE